MDTTRAKLQPQDPVAARLGAYVIRAGVMLAAVMVAASFIRG
jgi:hypothetical protein